MYWEWREGGKDWVVGWEVFRRRGVWWVVEGRYSFDLPAFTPTTYIGVYILCG
jgi:hypothetical protein